LGSHIEAYIWLVNITGMGLTGQFYFIDFP
jgi:hypothetical protein